MPFAGFSPSCWADLVQMEHWLEAELEIKNEKLKMKNNMRRAFFIR